MMRRVSMLAAVLALAGCMSGRAAPEGALPLAFAGSWEGSGTQSDQPGEWTIAASIVGGTPGGIIGTIAYPSLGCSGELRLRSADAARMELMEHITTGRCVDGGIITLTPRNDGGLRFDWRQEGSDVTAKGTLRRSGR